MTIAPLIVSLAIRCCAAAPAIQAGVAWLQQGTAVLAMSGPPLAPGAKVTLIAPEPPQRVHSARVRRQLAATPEIAARINGFDGAYYEIVGAAVGQDLPQLAVALLGEPPAKRLGPMWSFRLDDDLPDVRARECTSMEGVHLTLWSGEPLKSQREWHVYYYLGYDVDPTCQPGDTRDSGGPR